MSRYIDADAVIDALYREKRNTLMQDHNFVVRGIQASINCISNTPTIEPKRGEWISLHNGKWKCSECGIEVLIYAKGNFCPNCGADMRGVDDE